MNARAWPWAAIGLYGVSALSLIAALVFFVKMQSDHAEIARLRAQGVVSRALVVAKMPDETVLRGYSGANRRRLHVRHVPKSTVAFADFPSKVAEKDLPVALPMTRESGEDTALHSVMIVPARVYDRTIVGDMLTVVDTPWDREAPVLVAEVNAFRCSEHKSHMVLALLHMVVTGAAGVIVQRPSLNRRSA